MKSHYVKPKLSTFGDVESVTQATGSDPTRDFLFFTGSPINRPSDPWDKGRYSYFCKPKGCSPKPTP